MGGRCRRPVPQHPPGVRVQPAPAARSRRFSTGRPLAGLRARPPRDAVDTHRFVDAVERARVQRAGGDPAAAAATLVEALGWWRGPFAADLDTDALAGDRARFDELRLTAIEERFGAALDAGDMSVVPELERLVVEEPMRERLWASLMLALYRTGRQGDALRAFQVGREHLLNELGIDPTPSLHRLELAILRQTTSLDPPTPDRVLMWLDPSGKPQRARLRTDEEVDIGRAEGAAVRIDWDPLVSRRHARVSWEPGRQWVVIDDGWSANGTFLNGGRVLGGRQLADGDTIRVGNTTILVRTEATSPVARVPEGLTITDLDHAAQPPDPRG